MSQSVPHFLRFARALALVSGVGVVGCGSTVTSQDVPPTETAVVDAGISFPPDGVASPDVRFVDAGIAADSRPMMGVAPSPDVPPPGIAPPPDAGVMPPPDAVMAGIMPPPDAGAIDGIAPAPDAGPSDIASMAEGGPQVAPETDWA